MSKKENQKKSKNKYEREEKEEEEKAKKAVIIGEIFSDLLKPLNMDIPTLLLPLCGIPIIEFILDSLSSSSVFKETIICIKSHREQLEKYLKTNHKNLSYKIISGEFENPGDCLRKIEEESLISSDFVLIQGLTIINEDYDELYNIHKKSWENDKNCLVTACMKKFNNAKELMTKYDETILIYNNNDKRIYQFESTYEKEKSKNVEIYKSVNNKEDNEKNNYFIRSDLFETGIYICNVETLNIFKDNFELNSIRDVIKQILVNDELYFKTFYVHEFEKKIYCGMIRNIESYFKVNFEILNRWAYPIVLDKIDMSNKLKINLKQIKFSIYSDIDTNFENYKNVNLIGEIAILDQNNTVGEESILQRCILGKDVKIGKKCNLYNCFIYNHVTIEDEVTIKNSVIGNNCTIKKGIKIISSLLGNEINQENDAIQETIFLENENLNILDKELSLKSLKDSDYLFISRFDSFGFSDENLVQRIKDEDQGIIEIPKNIKQINKKTYNYDPEESLIDEDSLSDEEEDEEEEDFTYSINKILTSGIDEKANINDLVKEIGSIKNTFNDNTYEEMIKICLSIIITKFLDGEKFQKKHIEPMTKLLADWKPLFNRLVPNFNVQYHLISVIEQLCIEIDEISSAFHIIVQILAGDQCKVIADDAIMKWYKSKESYYDTKEEKVSILNYTHEKNKKKMKKFIEVVIENKGEEEEEEEDDDEEEEEEEDDDEEDDEKNKKGSK